MTDSARGIEAALAHVAALGEPLRDGGPAVLAGARRAILELLRRSEEPVPADAIARSTGLHPNTVRHHLGLLTAAGLIEDLADAPAGRGRPRRLYRASSAVTRSFAQVEASLQAALETHGEDELAMAAARLWLDAAPPVEPAKDLDDAVRTAAQTLEAVGFTARTDAIGDSIVVTDCPYASLITEHPMICTVHAELTASVLARTGQPVTLEAFDVWVRPGVCRARLSRPDTTPAFSTSPVHAPANPPAPEETP